MSLLFLKQVSPHFHLTLTLREKLLVYFHKLIFKVDSLANLDTFLVTAGFDSQTLLSNIQSLQILRKISQRCLVLFLDSYRKLVSAILDPVNKYEFPSSMISRTVEEVETLLSLHGDYS